MPTYEGTEYSSKSHGILRELEKKFGGKAFTNEWRLTRGGETIIVTPRWWPRYEVDFFVETWLDYGSAVPDPLTKAEFESPSEVMAFVEDWFKEKKKKRGSRTPWIIEITSVDPSRDATTAYRSRKAAIEEAIHFITGAAKDELEGIEWEKDDEAPTALKAILDDIAAGRFDAAITGWLDYQGDFDPGDKIALGPSGSVSDKSHDFSAIS